MKGSIKLFCITVIILLTASNSFSTPLNGTYIIGSGGIYPAINTAVSDAVAQGINGPVIFNIISGTYNEEVFIETIPGSSEINTVTLKSLTGNSADVVVNGVSHVFKIFSSNIIIEKLTIGNSNLNSIFLFGSNIKIRDNEFNNGSLEAAMGSFFYITGNDNIGNIEFEGEREIGPVLYNIHIINNKINQNVKLFFCFLSLIENNSIGEGLDAEHFTGVIRKNKITGYLISEGIVYNNFILGTVLSLTSNFRNNTVIGGSLTTPTVSYFANNFQNNIIINPSGGTALYSTFSDFSGSDYNNYFNGGNNNLINYHGTLYNNVADFYSATGLDQHSNSVQVTFHSPFDLHLAGPSVGDEQLAGIPNALVTDDIDGNPRNPLHPYKGADEVTDFPLPVELASFTSSVNNNNVNLKWTTATETYNSGFDVERQDARGETQDVWNKIGFVNGYGTKTSPNNYEFTDRNLASGKYNYRLKQIDFNGNFEYHNLADEVVIGVPDKFSLEQNYPNPFNPVTNLGFGISELGFVSLKVYNSLGKEVATLVNEIKPAGRYEVVFDGSNLSSGVYFYKIEAGSFSIVKRMILMK